MTPTRFGFRRLGACGTSVLYEILAQHSTIDLEERSDAIAAVEVLSRFDSTAGPLYAEVSERFTHHSNGVWADIGAKIDRAGYRWRRP